MIKDYNTWQDLEKELVQDMLNNKHIGSLIHYDFPKTMQAGYGLILDNDRVVFYRIGLKDAIRTASDIRIFSNSNKKISDLLKTDSGRRDMLSYFYSKMYELEELEELEENKKRIKFLDSLKKEIQHLMDENIHIMNEFSIEFFESFENLRHEFNEKRMHKALE